METTAIEKDIKIFFETAYSYPEGILEAHQRLHDKVPFSPERKYFGVSRPETGSIVYRAGTEEMQDGEAEKYGCERLVLKKGNYLSLTVHGFRKDPQKIGIAFRELLAQPGLDPQGYCVEWYLNDKDAVKCMIRLESL